MEGFLMKQIINGKMYNTETATEIATRFNGCTGWEYLEETLYRKKNGEFFLCGSGGPMTEYVVQCGDNSYTGSTIIKPFSISEAQKWTEEYASADTYIEFFGDVEE